MAPALNHERRGAGEPLVLLHHLGGEWQIFEPVLGALAVHHDTIAVDLPGFGASPALPASLEPTPWELGRQVGLFLDELGIERAHLAGISLGGWAALELAKRDRALSVTPLCAAGFWQRPLGPRPGISPRTLARLARPLVPLLFALPGVRRRALADAVADAGRIPRATAVRVLSAYARATDFDRANGHMRSNLFSDGERVEVPVTMAWGELDGQVSRPQSTPPGWREVVLRGCNHLPTLDDPAQVAGVVLDAARRAVSGQQKAGESHSPAPRRND